MNFGSSVDVGRIFYGTLQALGFHQPSFWEQGEACYDMRNKIVRRISSWQRSGVVSQQRLRLRLLTLVNRVPKLRFEPVSFLSLTCFSVEIMWQLIRLRRSEISKHYIFQSLNSIILLISTNMSKRFHSYIGAIHHNLVYGKFFRQFIYDFDYFPISAFSADKKTESVVRGKNVSQ